jgi:hypothetical protein
MVDWRFGDTLLRNKGRSITIQAAKPTILAPITLTLSGPLVPLVSFPLGACGLSNLSNASPSTVDVAYVLIYDFLAQRDNL